VRSALETRLPECLAAIKRAGGTPVSVHHTRLLALLPENLSDPEQLALSLAPPDRPASAALVSGCVERTRTRRSTSAVALLSGAAVAQALETLGALDPGEHHVSRVEEECSTDDDTPGDLSSEIEPFPDSHPVGICAVGTQIGSQTASRIDQIDELARELDGRVLLLEADQDSAVVTVAFALPAGEEASRNRACDFALLLRDQYGDGVRTGVSTGESISVQEVAGVTLPGCAGEPFIRAMDLLPHTEPGRVVTDGATAKALAGVYALQPIGGVTHAGKRSPAGTTIVLWREQPVATGTLFVGREKELQTIQSYLSDVTPSILHVTGPPGIGKSTIVQQIVRSRPSSSVLVVAGSDRPEAPFASLTDGLREYWDLPAQDAPNYDDYLSERLAATRGRIWDDELLATWDRVEQFMQHALGHEHPVASALDPETRHQGLQEGLVTLLSALQAVRIIWIDDYQWIDAGSAAVLASFLGSRDPSRLRVVTTVRTSPGDGSEKKNRPAAMEWESVTLRLEGLTGASALSLLERRGIAASIDRAQTDQIINVCKGNPFFLEQCARYVEEQLSEGNAPVIPDTVHAVILARIERLSANVRDAVEMAAVLGLRFDMRILSAMLREERLPTALQLAQREGFWEAANELSFIFCHALIRDAIYDAQFLTRRKELHAAAARAFEHVYSGEIRRAHLYELAEHFENAGNASEAIKHLSEAADYALEQFQNERAVALLKRRRSLAGETDLRACHQLAATLVHVGAWEEAVELFEIAADRSAEEIETDEAQEFARCSGTYAEFLIERGEVERAEAILNRALEIDRAKNNGNGASFIYRSLGLVSFHRGEYDGAVEHYEQALQHARSAGDERLTARLMNNLAIVHSKQGKHKEALSAFESNLEYSRRLNDFTGKSTALNNIGYLHDAMGEHEKAMPYFQEDLKLCVEASHRQGEAIARGNIASILSSLHRHEEAVETFLETIEIDSRIGFLPHKAYNLQLLGSSLIALGQKEEGCARLREAAELAEKIQFPMVQEKTKELLEGCAEAG
jgi:tetratricopeptide (TPR) repeat protein